MKILVDMNLSPRWAAELRSKGIDSIHWQNIGEAHASDEEVLAWCAAHGRVLFTHNLNFSAISLPVYCVIVQACVARYSLGSIRA